jgi:carboxylesterase
MSKKPYGVLILHGFTASLDCVREIEPPLKALGLPTRMPVLRGHGAESPQALKGVTWHDWVADAESALQDLLTEVEKVIVIGHSMGGLVTLTLAADHADEIDSIILAAAAVQMTSPMAPGHPFNFLAPVLGVILKKWDFPQDAYADKSLIQYNTNYLWAPIDAVESLLDFSKATRKRLAEVKLPALIIQSHNDSSVAPESAEIIYKQISTPAELKRIAWFEITEHEMFRDCERYAIIDVIANYVRERTGVKETIAEKRLPV